MSVAIRKPSCNESLPHELGGVAYGRRHGRGAQSNRSGRFEARTFEPVDDGWESLGDLDALQTEVQEVPARGVITKNES
ncbi:MAG: radical SAM protein, partial [Methyloceanibacter sp.]